MTTPEPKGMWCFRCQGRSSDPSKCTVCGHEPGLETERGIFSDLSADYADVGKARRWFSRGAIEDSPLAVLTAPEKSGKSWMLIDLVVSTVTGTAWLRAFRLGR